MDQTPVGPKSFHRALTIDAAGHISVGESLDSIDEEKSFSTENGATTPGAIEAGMGQQGLSFSSQGQQSVGVPFGSAVTPTAAGSGTQNSGVPLVDHTPSIAPDNGVVAASIAVLGDTTIGGDLGRPLVIASITWKKIFTGRW